MATHSLVGAIHLKKALARLEVAVSKTLRNEAKRTPLVNEDMMSLPAKISAYSGLVIAVVAA